MKKIDRDVYDWGEIERDADRAAQMVNEGSWAYRLLKWVERWARSEREGLIVERDEERRIERDQRARTSKDGAKA